MAIPESCDSCGEKLGEPWYPLLSGGKIFYFCEPCATKYHQVVTALGGEENEL
jgi:hypothetical protein